MFGNICHQCESNYILVNNLCCDHNCLAKLFRSHSKNASQVTQSITNNYQTLSQIIPYITQKYNISSQMHNLVEIATHDYIDVTRFAILYEFYFKGKMERYRAIVDLPKVAPKGIIDVDWSRMAIYENYIDYHHEEIVLQKVPVQVMQRLIPVGATDIKVKRVQFAYLQQYEIIYFISADQMVFQTSYVQPVKQRPIHLIRKQERIKLPTPVVKPTIFTPSSKTLLTTEQINQQYTTNSNYILVISYLQKKTNLVIIQSLVYKIIRVKIFYETAQLTRYEITVFDPQKNQNVTYFIVQNPETKSIQLIETIVEKLPTIKEIIIEQIIKQTIQTVQKQECEGDNCDIQVELDAETLDPNSSLNKLIRLYNPQLKGYTIIKKWVRTFLSYKEITVLIRDDSQLKYLYFNCLFILKNKQHQYWGQQYTTPLEDPKIFQKVAPLPNRQFIVTLQETKSQMQLIYNQDPKMMNDAHIVTRSTIRYFPENYVRFVITIRKITSIVQYIILKQNQNSQNQMWVQQMSVREINLPVLSKQSKEVLQVKQKLELIVQAVLNKESIPKEADLTNQEPLVYHTAKPSIELEQTMALSFIKSQPNQQQQILLKKIWSATLCGRLRELTILVKLTTGNKISYEYHYMIYNPTNSVRYYLGKQPTTMLYVDDNNKLVIPNDERYVASTQKPLLSQQILTEKGLINTDHSKMTIISSVSRVFPLYVRNSAIVFLNNRQLLIISLTSADKKFTIICSHLPSNQIEQVLTYEQIQLIKEEQIITEQIIEHLAPDQQTQEVQEGVSTEIQKFIYQQLPLTKQLRKVMVTWTYRPTNIIREIVVLMQIGLKYSYIFVITKNTPSVFLYSGKTDTDTTVKDQKGALIMINPQRKLTSVPETNKIKQFLNKNKPIVSINQINIRQFPIHTRYTAIVTQTTEVVKYIIIQDPTGVLTIYDRVVLHQIPPQPTSAIKIEHLIEETIKTIAEIKKQDTQQPIVIEQTLEQVTKMSEEEVQINRLIQVAIPTLKSLEILQMYVRSGFITFEEITLIIRIDKKTYYYVYLWKNKIKFEIKPEIKFWGLTLVTDPKLISNFQNTQYSIINNQQVVSPLIVPNQIKLAAEKYPKELSNAILVRVVYRVFPDGRDRSQIIYREQTQQVMYVVITSSTNQQWIQQRTVLQSNLQPLSKLQPIKTNEIITQSKLQVAVTQLMNGTKIDQVIKQISNITQFIQLPVEFVDEPEQKLEEIVEIDKTDSVGNGNVNFTNGGSQDQLALVKQLMRLTDFKVTHTGIHTLITEKSKLVQLLSQKFCDHTDYILLYQQTKQKGYISLAFRTNILGASMTAQFLHYRRISFIQNQPFLSLLGRILSPTTKQTADSALKLITSKYSQYATMTPLFTKISQLGSTLRYTIIYKYTELSNSSPNTQTTNNLIHRFVVVSKVSTPNTLSILQQCRLLSQKTTTTYKQVTTTNTTGVISTIQTNKVQLLQTKDPNAVKVIDLITTTENKKNMTDIVITEITAINYLNGTQYITGVQQKNLTTNATVTKQFIVIFNNITKNNTILQEIIKTEKVVPEEIKPKQEVILIAEEIIPNRLPVVCEIIDKKPQVILVDPVTTKPHTGNQKLDKIIDQINKVIVDEKNQIIPAQNIKIINITDQTVGTLETIKQVVIDKTTNKTFEIIAVVNPTTEKFEIVEEKPAVCFIQDKIQPVEIVKIDVQELVQVIEKVISKKGVLPTLEECWMPKKLMPTLPQCWLPEGGQKPKVVIIEPMIQLPEVIIPVTPVTTPQVTTPQVITLPVLPNPVTPIQPVTQVKIDPIDIQKAISKLPQKQQQLPVKFTLEQAKEYLQATRPDLKPETITRSEMKQDLKNSTASLTLETQKFIYNIILKKDTSAIITQIYYDATPKVVVQPTPPVNVTVEEIIIKIQKNDTNTYTPIDPIVLEQQKALKALKETQPILQHQVEIDLDKTKNDQFTELLNYVRAFMPALLKDSVTIRIVQDINTLTTKQYTISFFTQTPSTDPSKPKTSYKVIQVIVQVRINQTKQKEYHIIEIKEVMQDGQQKNQTIFLQSKQTYNTNIAYGFRILSSAEISADVNVQHVLTHIKKVYKSVISNQTLLTVEILELLNGKINMNVRYTDVHFVVYYDPTLQRVLLLNPVHSMQYTDFKTVENPTSNNFYRQATQYCVSKKDVTAKDQYAITSAGQIKSAEDLHVFYLEILSGKKKYRCVVSVSNTETKEIVWNQIVEIALDHYKFQQMIKEYVSTYKKVSDELLKNNFELGAVLSFAKNKNSMITTAKFLGAATKPQNLGSIYKLFFMLTDSTIVSIEIYRESFSQKSTQVSYVAQDFVNNFVGIKPQGDHFNKIMSIAAKKVGIDLTAKDYTIEEVSGKDYFFGNLFKFVIGINGTKSEGLVYHDHITEETNLIYWRTIPKLAPCRMLEVDKSHCLLNRCNVGYYWAQDRFCYREVAGCTAYATTNRSQCITCSAEYQIINNVCTKDCGTSCRAAVTA